VRRWEASGEKENKFVYERGESGTNEDHWRKVLGYHLLNNDREVCSQIQFFY